ncbi:MAG: hypothetical protein QW738_09390, partial [Nitrososphaeria archaeon]
MTHILRGIVDLKKAFPSNLAFTATVVALQPLRMIMVLFGVTTTILSGVLIGPIVYGLFWRRTTASAVTIAMIISFISDIAASTCRNFGFP